MKLCMLFGVKYLTIEQQTILDITSSNKQTIQASISHEKWRP